MFCHHVKIILFVVMWYGKPTSAAKVGLSSVSSTLVRGTSFVPTAYSPLKLPVWPVWGGVLAQVADWCGSPSISEKITSSIGGRVVPMTNLNEQQISPFLLLAHHSHSFTPFDPLRAITKFILPEGFPAHPHSGFDTVTYCIDGGLKHRDSEGLEMSYGDGDVQWMSAARG